ncbi:hypothetical protein JCM11251_007724 [Rhodosporidiobolus azoricus]
MLPTLRDRYSVPPDFSQLACDVPAFAPFTRSTGKGGSTIDWKDAAAVRSLTSALLERDFQLKVALPEDRLCPMVPSRLEYVLFVLRLVLATFDAPSASSTLPSLVGLDIGTGASCIYPLLAQRTYSRTSSSSSTRLKMLATDIDPRSLSYARRNVAQNGLEKEIEVFEVVQEDKVFPEKVINNAERIDFTMCNPPFYASEDEISSSLTAKELDPFAVCTGASNELLTQGGEVAFVSRMIEESLELGKDKIRWFTSLLGKFSSIAPLVELLKSQNIANYAVTPLPPQGQTTRWLIAWSLQDYRFPVELLYPNPLDLNPLEPPSSALNSGASTTRFLPPSLLPSTYHLPASVSSSSPALSLVDVRTILDDMLRDLAGGRGHDGGKEDHEKALSWTWRRREKEEASIEEEVVVRARRNVWSRSARRAAAGKGKGKEKATEPALMSVDAGSRGGEPGEGGLLLEMRLLVRPSPAASAASENAEDEQPPPPPPQPLHILALWTRGTDVDRAAYVGLWGYLVRKIGEAVRAKCQGEHGGEAGVVREGATRKVEEAEDPRGKRRKIEGDAQ